MMIVEASQIIYSISELNSKARLLLETQLGAIWVTGELSNVVAATSGHLYFTLKDKDAQVRCALFRHNNRRTAFTPTQGQHVMARANVSLYESRGDYQLIVSELQLAGDGLLQRAFEQLKQTLQALGLFDVARKKAIPRSPRCIGVITSPSGAAIHDILKVLHHRNPSISVIIYPTIVQGTEAKEQIVAAIELANQRQECDVLLLARGGGSLEDLWPFNEALVAHAIAASTIPIVTGVGHEVDITIADFVADHRAPTPSAAAEYVSPDQAELRQRFMQINQYINQYIYYYLEQLHYKLNALTTRLKHPGDKLREQAQDLERLSKSLHYYWQVMMDQKQHHLSSVANQLNTLSPLSTLERGYAIATNKDKQLISSVQEIAAQETIHIQLRDGQLTCVVV